MSASSVSPDDEHAKLLPADWEELEPLVDAVLDVAPEQRESLIVQLASGDAARADALRALVADCEREMPLLDTPAPEAFARLIDDQPEQTLPELLGDRYRIERELGRGGMARVFLAMDIKHNRPVAVKVIRPELAASLGRERFLREIAIAARLRHPNIVPLFDSGDADGVLYFVMPYEDGLSLRQRVDQGKALPSSEYVSVLRDVARALAYAHEHGVVHRDVKPDNVMLSGRAAVVTDFGIAKAVSIAQGGRGNTTTLTQSGSGIGTPTYMAPEQAVGDPDTDHRADIYSFGCLAYELISGKPPFHGMPIHQLVASHVATAPVPISDIVRDVPEAIARVVMQCLAKEPADRPQSAEAVLKAFDSLGSTSAHTPATVTPAPLSSTTATVATASSARGRTRIAVAGLAVFALAVATYAMFRMPATAAASDVTVAVLPLQSGGGDTVQRALAEGLSDEVATELFKVPGVRVMSRRGVGNYRNQREIDTEKLGRELGVSFLVMGTLREVDGRLRVLASLVRASDGAVLWSDRFDRAQNELGAVRSNIAEAVGDTLAHIAGTSGASAQAATRRSKERTIDPEAYRLYVLAQRALDRRGISMQLSVDNFRQATAIDSTYAAAWAGLSLAQALTPYFTPGSAPAMAPQVRSSAARALSLDSTLATPHVALALALQHAYKWDSAETEHRIAVRLRTAGDVEPLIQYGRHLLFRGRVQEGMEQLMLARRTEPASAVISSWVAYAYYLGGQLDSALAESRRGFQNDSTNGTMLNASALIRQRLDMPAEARRFAEKIPPVHYVLAYVLSAQGDSASAMARLRESLAQHPMQRPNAHVTRAYAMLGARDTSAALTELEKATDSGQLWPSFQSVVDPVYESVWPASRFHELLRRVGLGDIALPAARNH